MSKKIISLVLAFLMVLSMAIPDMKASAGGIVIGIDENGNEEPDVETLTGDENGGWGWSLYVDCESDQQWTAKANKSWIKLDGTFSSSTKGTGPESFSVYLKKNTSGDSRDGKITVSVTTEFGAIEETVFVEQEGSEVRCSLLSSTKLTASRYGGNGKDVKIDATSNTSWRITGKPSWISLDAKSGKGSANVATNFKANTGKKNRTATLKIQYYKDSKWQSAATIKITQYGTTSNKW